MSGEMLHGLITGFGFGKPGVAIARPPVREMDGVRILPVVVFIYRWMDKAGFRTPSGLVMAQLTGADGAARGSTSPPPDTPDGFSVSVDISPANATNGGLHVRIQDRPVLSSVGRAANRLS